MNRNSFFQARAHAVRSLVAAIFFAGVFGAQAQPFIVSTVPANNASGVSPSAAVVFTFSEQMDTARTVAQFFNVMVQPLSTTTAWSANDTVLTCTPTPPFPASSPIIWTVQGESLIGDELEGNTGGFFMTGGGGGSPGTGTNRITTFAIGKLHLYHQTSVAAPTLDPDFPFNFSATTTLASNRSANSVTLTLPAGAVSNLTQNFLQPESFYLFAPWTNLALFNANFSAGNYVFNVMAATSNQQVTVNLADNLIQPNAPRISNFSAAQSVDAAQPFQLSWDAFQNGTAANYITVSISDVFKSPDAGTPGALNGTSTSIVIPAGTLQTDSVYDATVSFYRANTTSNASYTTSAYLATSTDFMLRTSGGGVTAPLVFTNSAWSGGAFSFEVISSPAQILTVEYSSTLLTNEWEILRTTNSATGLASFTHTTTNQYLFYRARKGP